MKIRASRIRSPERYLSRIPSNTRFRPIFRLATASDPALTKIGFPANPGPGSMILPVSMGPVTDFNANGKYLVRKDLPKEPRYINTIEWSWEQWAGRYGTETVTEERDIWKECYPREFVPPPAVELTFIQNGDTALLAGPLFTRNSSEPADICHAINIFLEAFGECEIVRNDLTEFAAVRTRRLNWRLLPPGQHPWDRVSKHLRTTLKRTKDPRLASVIYRRHETIQSYGPDAVYVGEGGFDRYVAYLFSSRKLVVLECTEADNAIYVFGTGWEEFSKLTKREVLQANRHVARIIHSKGWRTKFRDIMRRHEKKAA